MPTCTSMSMVGPHRCVPRAGTVALVAVQAGAGGRPCAALLWRPGLGQAEDPLPQHHPDCSKPHEYRLSTPDGGNRGAKDQIPPVPPLSPVGSMLLPSWVQVAGVHSQALPDLPDGTFDLDQLELTIREAHGSRYHPRPELICLENTHSSAGGRVLPLTYLRQVRELADRYGLQVHMDGARLMNAAVAQGVEPAQITQHCDSVSLCFSKGLGAPAGAVLAGRREFIAEAWRVRKLLGGGMRQAGVLAAAALLGLQHAEATLHRDHDNARRFAEGIHMLDSPLCSVNLAAVETNIVMVNVRGAWPSPAELCDHLRATSEEEVAETGEAVSVLLLPWSAHTVRAVWHRDISVRDTELARSKLEFVARKCQEKLVLGLRPTPPGTGEA
ncbi:uncharacterized protein LOC126642107 isoform X2 [Myiozetetes cayanensis]|uniref:uncharacterized protein LOC126642107 isoform X2 n=1 Tax=Myiozetetes cayanensis TaxID=478635 RepID=UPI00215EF175|nr:uncharacterized protein LOC126642107 isoform X2 [Myiozetetes cayanensis]